MSTNDENKFYPINEDNTNDNSTPDNTINTNNNFEGATDNSANTSDNFINSTDNFTSANDNSSNTTNSNENSHETQSIYSNQPPQQPTTPPQNEPWNNTQTTSTWSTPIPPQTRQQYNAEQQLNQQKYLQKQQQQYNQQQQQQYNQQQQQQQPNQQTQWTFHDYSNNGKPPKPPKPPKQAGSNTGLKVFAVIVSIMFVLTLSSLSLYVIYDDQPGTSQGVQDSSKSTSSTPKIDTQSKPEVNNNIVDESGRMSAVAVNKKVSPSVVGIVSYVQSVGYQVAGQGSGIIMTADGYIVTNHHVITSEDPRYPIAKVEVFLSTGENYIATVVGTDSKTDLAVLKIEGSNFTAAAFGDSSKLEVGETVYVIGNPSGLEFAGSMTGGIVSAVNRELNQTSIGQNNKFIQTNAAINPGNSGGALVNEFGQIVGITSNKVVATGFEGMGFAIPSNDAKTVVDSLMENGYVKGRVKIGISYTAIGETFSKLNGIPVGLRVESFEQGSQPDLQGVLLGDIITKMDGKDVYDSATIKAVLDGKAVGDPLELTIYRVNTTTGIAGTITITLALVEDQG